MRRVGILGGTFDPPHLGHLIIAEEVRCELKLDEIWFMPANEPPHKKQATTSAKDRVNMLQYTIEGNPYFKINTTELNRPGKSYTIDTIRFLKIQHPDIEFYFIIGGDMVEYLPKWKDIDQLIELVTFVGVKRTGFTIETDYPILIVDVPTIDISSTMIRKRLKENKTVTYFLKTTVYTYIKENGFYGCK